jgi:hypothetical protein
MINLDTPSENFSLNSFYLDALGLVFTSSDKYYDLGYVDSVVNEYERLSELYDDKDTYETSDTWMGMCSTHGRDTYIFYKEMNSFKQDLHLRAHEETHALEHMNQLERLSEALDLNDDVEIDFTKGYDPEVIAELGAIYALRMRSQKLGGVGCYISYLLRKDSFYSDDFWEAKKLYDSSQWKPNRSFF